MYFVFPTQCTNCLTTLFDDNNGLEEYHNLQKIYFCLFNKFKNLNILYFNNNEVFPKNCNYVFHSDPSFILYLRKAFFEISYKDNSVVHEIWHWN